MRRAVWHLLVGTGNRPWANRVYEPDTVPANPTKPFLIVREGVELNPDNFGSSYIALEVWPHVDRTSYKDVDSLETQVAGILNHALFRDTPQDGANLWQAIYTGTSGQDTPNDQWQTFSRPMRFNVFNIAWLEGLTYEPDPITTLRTWTQATFPAYQTDPAGWNPSDAAPGVYWRWTSFGKGAPPGIESPTQWWGTWFLVELRGHVIVQSYDQRFSTARHVIESLNAQERLRMSDGGPLLLWGVTAADATLDPFRQGQIRVQAFVGFQNPLGQPTPTVINNVFVHPVPGVSPLPTPWILPQSAGQGPSFSPPVPATQPTPVPPPFSPPAPPVGPITPRIHIHFR